MEISRRKRKMFSLLVTVAVLIAAFAFAPAVREAAAQVIGYGFSPEPEDDGNPDCGKDPSRWNPIGGHYERRYNKFCEQFTGDPNESLCHDMWHDECPGI
jgi:hypothetical protein